MKRNMWGTDGGTDIFCRVLAALGGRPPLDGSLHPPRLSDSEMVPVPDAHQKTLVIAVVVQSTVMV